MAEGKPSVLRPLVWLGDSRRNIQVFPLGARKLVGDELQLVQFGGMPKDAKPFHGVGSGVFQLALAYESNAYRAVVAVQLGAKIYVLNTRSRRSQSQVSKRPRKTLI